MKKILYIITKSNWGGAQKYVFDLATSLPRDKFSIYVASGGSGKLQEKLAAEHIESIKIRSLERDISILKDLKVIIEINKICKEKKLDIVHLNSSKIGLLGSIASRLSGVPKIIFTAHGWAFNEKRSFLYKNIMWLSSWITSLISTDIIVLSEKEKRQAQKFPFVSKKKIQLIRNGLKEINFLSQQEARQKLDLEENKKYVGTIAELHQNKGLDILINSFKGVPANLVIIGSGEEEQKLKDMAKNMDNIKFLGNVENAPSLLKAFDVFVLSSRKEGLPYALLEASLAELEIVATNVGGVSEIIKDGETGLLTDPSHLTESINRALREKSFGKKARDHVKNNFSFEKTLDSTLELYHCL